ncbi:hypothetical protein GV054_09040 [Marinomonas mediterranea]|uniref:Uncharacterized protein n=1 Tax=Marinomonas mediterranea (strain ATCC 700492 / JCM 21426 / NBRC 103028 / MMB-1) TaxID=717774 RepID=F2K1E6_MARM1|nr:hypothetical protein [Marinomonas mediterranea]ADZ91077.1 hypothetical protein Marme_1821 [Marinomonas mediterranea MMB-1]WCN13141.1 hypothetical protein GV054_09040 [Marinomonas mediterranea]WCN17212.1 hypothetical protein GV053_09205 [Marinomonas mediterranea MMB-1]
MEHKPRIRVKQLTHAVSQQDVDTTWKALMSKAHEDVVKAKLQYQCLAVAQQYGYNPCVGKTKTN